MITRDQVREAVDRLGRHYEQLPYTDLEDLAGHNEGWGTPLVQDIGGTQVTLQPLVQRTGRLRPRIAVEVFAEADELDRWWWRPCYYFERYPSGRIERFDRFGWQDVFLWGFLLVGLATLVYGVVRLALWLLR